MRKTMWTRILESGFYMDPTAYLSYVAATRESEFGAEKDQAGVQSADQSIVCLADGQDRAAETSTTRTAVELFVSPVCPWNWIASRWLSSITSDRDLVVRWRSFSPEIRDGETRLSDAIPSFMREAALAGRAIERSVLSVFEVIRSENGEAAVGEFYTELGRRLFVPGRAPTAPPADVISAALIAAGLDPALEGLADEPRWQGLVRESTEEAMAVVGRDAMTPVMALKGDPSVGISGPIMSSVPSKEDGLRIWDAFRVLLESSNFFELKRQRTQAPQFPAYALAQSTSKA